MSEGFERLKQIGAQKIHNDTHIAIQYIEAILEEDFPSLTKVQFLGFLSILEREYHLNLSEYKEQSLELFQVTSSYTSSESHLFVVAQKQRNYTPLYIAIAFIIFVIVAFVSINLEPLQEKVFLEESKVIKKAKIIVENEIQKREIEKEKIVEEIKITPKVKKTIEEERKDVREKKESIQNNKQVEDTLKEKKFLLKQELVILPRSKVWLGYIDLKNDKKRSLTVQSSLNLSLRNDYLFMFGHGRIDLELDGQKFHYKTAKTLRLLYKDGKFKKLSVTEFKVLNKGKKW